MRNMNSIIKSHNERTLKNTETEKPSSGTNCNCRSKDNCPLQGNCLTSAVVYKATVNHNGETKTYIGNTGGAFKDRYRNHTKSFRNQRYETETELSKYIWGLKKNNINPDITWSIVQKSNTHRRKSGICNLCLDEKLAIVTNKTNNLLNTRREIICKCRHHCPRPPERNRTPSYRAV